MPDYIASLDLGQAGDYTALSILKRTIDVDAEGLPVRDHAKRLMHRTAVVALERYALGTPYPAVVASVSGIVRRPELGFRPRLTIDATGVGRAVTDMFLNELRSSVEVFPITITAGAETRKGAWGSGIRAYWTPKAELVSAVQAGLGTGRLKIAKGLKEGETLKRELLDFKIKVTASARETFNAREGAHDDLVLSVAMGVWLSGRREIPYIAKHPDDSGRAALALEQEEREALEKERQVIAEKQRQKALGSVWDNPAAWRSF
jgi:hypothetical protein